jgi:ubiquinone/menaquinone biosynthesis C-methylase UbiE
MLASEPQIEAPVTRPPVRMPALSIVVPVLEPGAAACLASLEAACDSLGLDAEILAAGTAAGAPASRRVRWVQPSGAGFGLALRAGLDAARGEYVATVDAACADAAAVLEELWNVRDTAEVIVASRYVPGAEARMSAPRRVLSYALNKAFGRGLSLPVTDLSSAFRLYRAEVLRAFKIRATDYDVLPELLVRALAGGWRVREIPLRIELSRRSRAVRPLARLAAAYARTFAGLWQLRNSIGAADYDARAHDSIIPLQRYWQRQRHRHVTELIAGQGAVLDVGCGSSRIIAALPPDSVAMDILANKLRYARRFSRHLVRASGFAIPFPDASFPCVLCSQVIEHVPMDSPILSELHRVLAPGGRLVLGTPDYANWEWVWMEKAYGFFKPGGYADEHIAHYTREGLLRHYRALGYVHEDTRYILRGELILAFRKPK